jgi:hypothetical protein
VAHVVLKNVQRDVGDRLYDFAVAQPTNTRMREVRIGEFTPLNHNSARKFENGIGSGVSRACVNRLVDFGFI